MQRTFLKKSPLHSQKTLKRVQLNTGRQKERCFSTVAPVVPSAAERTVKMSSFIFDGSLIATAFAFSFFFVCLRFLCYFLFLKKVGSPSPINPNLKIKCMRCIKIM